MIIEVAVVAVSVSLTVITALSLRFARLQLEQEAKDDPVSVNSRIFAEKRRVLERERAEWLSIATKESVWSSSGERAEAAARLEKVNKALLAVAEEERLENKRS